MAKPFHGVRILDFTHVLSGPFATHQLGLLGADIVKIEKLGGEDLRFGPIYPEWAAKGLSPTWMSVNANKRSLTLDLKKPEAVAIVLDLARDADVVIENFRPGVMDALGIGHAAISAINPRLIYCAVSGFGQDGPERDTAAFDGMIQAMCGVMSITGTEETGPLRVGFPFADMVAGMTTAFAVSSALFQRTHTGRGQFVDVSMLDASVAFMTRHLFEYMLVGAIPRPEGNLSASKRPTADMFPTAAGNVVLAALTDRQFTNLMRALDRADVLADPRFADWPARIANGKALREIIVRALAAAPAAEWAARLKAMDVPCGVVSSVDQVVHHPQLAHRDVFQRIDGPTGPMTVVGSGFRFAHDGSGVDRPPPLAGEHTDEILAGIGYTPERIAALRQAKVV